MEQLLITVLNIAYDIVSNPAEPETVEDHANRVAVVTRILMSGFNAEKKVRPSRGKKRSAVWKHELLR